MIIINHSFTIMVAKNVFTNNGKYFLNILDKHFPQNHHLDKIFGWNRVKVSYSCNKNIKTINNHKPKPQINISTSNFRNKEACPSNEQCQIGEVVYEGNLSSNQPYYRGKKVFWNCRKIFQKMFLQPRFIFQKRVL